MTQISMFDTIRPRDLLGHIPTVPRGEAVAGYVEGNTFIDAALLFHLFPHAYHLTIGGTGGTGRTADIEQGFGVLDRFGAWLTDLADLSQGPPVGYTFASEMAALQSVAHRLEIPDADHAKPAPIFDPRHGSRLEYLRAVGVLWWSAHFNFRPHICGVGCSFPRAHSTQFTDHALPAPLDADQSVVENADVFFPAGKQLPPDPHRFLVFCSGLHNQDGSERHPGGNRGGPWHSPYGLLDERETVIQFYAAHRHPDKFHGWLLALRTRMLWLTQRLDRVAILLNPLSDGTPSWRIDNRGERHERLAHMATTGELA